MKRLIYKIMSLFKIKKMIILESFPTYTDNAKAIYDYLIQHKYNEKYCIIWFCDNSCKVKLNDYNVKMVKVWKNVNKISFWGFFKYFHYLKNAKYILYCNRGVYKLNPKTIRIYLNHAILLKKISDLKTVSPKVDYTICPSDFFLDVYSEQLHLPKEKILVLGTPRNDLMKTYQKEERDFTFIPKKFKKIIFWLPTFRNHRDEVRNDSSFSYPLGIPIIYDNESLQKMDELLRKEDILLLIKMHPAQDMKRVSNINLNNIKLITDNDLLENNISLIEFLFYVDAVLTDYSGVYYDALLADRVIGFTIDDFEEYQKERGFAFADPLKIMAGMKIYNLKDLEQFIKDLANNHDEYQKERKEMTKLLFDKNDGKACERIIKFLKI